MGKKIFTIFLTAVFLLAGSESLFAGKAARRHAEQMRRNCVMQNKAYDGNNSCFDCPAGQELDTQHAMCRQSAVKCGEGERVSNGKCVSVCPAGQIWQGGQCVLEKCPDGYVKHGNQCLKDSGPKASGDSTGAECGTVMVAGKWKTGVRCPAGYKCENPTGRTGTCVAGSAVTPAGKNRVENNADGYCGKVKNPNGATDTVTCGGGMTCEPLAHVSDTDASDSICKQPAAAASNAPFQATCTLYFDANSMPKSQIGVAIDITSNPSNLRIDSDLVCDGNPVSYSQGKLRQALMKASAPQSCKCRIWNYNDKSQMLEIPFTVPKR